MKPTIEMVPIKVEDWRYYERRVDLIGTLLRFTRGDAPVVELKNFKHANAQSLVTGLVKARKRAHLDYIKIERRGERVFLVNTLRETT